MIRAALAVLVLALAGCSIIGHKPPPDGWPKLTETVTFKSLWDVNAECSRADGAIGSFLMLLIAPHMACAHINLDSLCVAGTCSIVTSSDLFIEHEREHCAGRDHFGSTMIADYFQSCLNRQGRP